MVFANQKNVAILFGKTSAFVDCSPTQSPRICARMAAARKSPKLLPKNASRLTRAARFRRLRHYNGSAYFRRYRYTPSPVGEREASCEQQRARARKGVFFCGALTREPLSRFAR